MNALAFQTPGKLFTERLQLFGELVERCRHKVVPVVEPLEPERGNLVEHSSFVRNRIRQDHVKGGDTIGDDKQQRLAEIENFAYLPAAQFLGAW